VNRLGGTRKALVGALATSAIGLLVPSLASMGTASADTSVPAPNLGHFIPASDQITSERQIHLTSSGPAQVVVDFQSAEPNAQGKTPEDLIILSWDRFAKRWVTVWDGAKVQSPNATSTSGGLAFNAVLPSAAFISNLTYRAITPAKGRTDLEFEDFYNFGANGSVQVGIVHYDGQSATLAYYDSVNPGSSRPKVTGKAPHQELSVPIGWLTSADPQCCAVRTYVNTVAFRKQSFNGGYAQSNYVVTSSTQSWLGVYALLPDQTNGTWPNPVVMSVLPGSPAAGVLQVGDQLAGVAGVSPPSSASNGSPFMDEVAKSLPGTKIVLNIVRGTTPLVVNVTLGSTAEAAYTKDQGTPSPGYLGVDVTSMTPTLQSQYGFTTSSGAVVLSVVDNSPASSAGLTQGDVITSLGSTLITSAEDLQNAAELTPAFTAVQVGYTNTSGSAQSTSITMGDFPQTSPGPEVTEV
jgi:PDZ domain